MSLGVQTEAFIDLSVHPNGGELASVGVASDLEIWRLEGLSQSLAHALTLARKRRRQNNSTPASLIRGTHAENPGGRG